MRRCRFALIALLAVACIDDIPENLMRLQAAEARLRAIPGNAQSLDFILGKLNDHRRITRNNAAAILRLLAGDPKVRAAIAPRAVPALIEVAGRHNDNQQEGMMALGEFREYGAPAVPLLIRRLSDDERTVTEALGMIGPASAPAIPLLRKNLRSDDMQMRILTAVAIRRIAPDDREAIDNLIELLHGRDREARLSAISALQDLGPLALPALPALEADKDAENAVRTIKHPERR
ncbi:MAG: hypothetical protein M3041_09705 [Acidobacteriota bacterium]|nr:hypothetical protein [Acidobacteriota bacterium]